MFDMEKQVWLTTPAERAACDVRQFCESLGALSSLPLIIGRDDDVCVSDTLPRSVELLSQWIELQKANTMKGPDDLFIIDIAERVLAYLESPQIAFTM